MKLYIEKLMIIFNREFTGYFRTPLASIFLLVFLALSAGMTFFMGQFFQRGQADLNSFLIAFNFFSALIFDLNFPILTL